MESGRLARRRPGARLLFAAALPTEAVEVPGEGVDGMWDARRPAAESQILLVVGMDHIDPPVRTNHGASPTV